MKMVWGMGGEKKRVMLAFFSVKGAHVITLSYEQIAYELYVELKRSFVPILIACFILSGSLSLSISHAIFIHFFTWHYLIRVPVFADARVLLYDWRTFSYLSISSHEID